MRKIIITCALLFLCIVAFCQDVYVNNNGDTVRGKVTNYTEWVRNPANISFQENSGNTVQLTPLTCKAFTVANSDIYISYSGTRVLNTDNATDIHSLKSDILTTEQINAFLRQVYSYKGFALYKFIDGKRTNFYLSKNGTLKELEYYEYVDDDKVRTHDAYKSYILSQVNDIDVPGKANKAEALTYSEDALVNFFAEVLNDKAQGTVKKRTKYANEVFIGAGAHANFGTITYQDGAKAHQTTIAPLLEAGIRVHAQRNFGKAFLQTSLAFSTLAHTINPGNEEAFKTSATVFSLRLGPGYTFIKSSNISVYGTFLVSLDFLFDYKSTYGAGVYATTVKSGETLTKLTLVPEVGVVFKHSLNVALQGILPYSLPLIFFGSDHYSVYGAGVVVRYMF